MTAIIARIYISVRVKQHYKTKRAFAYTRDYRIKMPENDEEVCLSGD